jgi:hypothetical protein
MGGNATRRARVHKTSDRGPTDFHVCEWLRECPKVKWLANYAILGPHDYLDISSRHLRDETVAAKVYASRV